ncbi:MAG: VRR-NUC domain-containing protein [Phycisphaerales bacterium]
MISESKIQASCVMWLWNTHPQTRGLFFSVTNNSEHIARAMQRKAIGLISGVSDCLFIWRGSLYCFEFKTEIGRQSPAQIEWEKKSVEQGAKYYVVRSLPVFIDRIETILSNSHKRV